MLQGKGLFRHGLRTNCLVHGVAKLSTLTSKFKVMILQSIGLFRHGLQVAAFLCDSSICTCRSRMGCDVFFHFFASTHFSCDLFVGRWGGHRLVAYGGFFPHLGCLRSNKLQFLYIQCLSFTKPSR